MLCMPGWLQPKNYWMQQKKEKPTAFNQQNKGFTFPFGEFPHALQNCQCHMISYLFFSDGWKGADLVGHKWCSDIGTHSIVQPQLFQNMWYYEPMVSTMKYIDSFREFWGLLNIDQATVFWDCFSPFFQHWCNTLYSCLFSCILSNPPSDYFIRYT